MRIINFDPTGGAPDPADAVQISDPTPQTQVAAGAASVTFSAPSGGTGSYTYAAMLSKPGGSSASLSGSGLGPYTFTTDSTGIYEVILTVTDSLGFETTGVGVVSLVTDYLPPSPPARQDLTAGTTSANVDFGRATGQTTSGTPTGFIDKPSGSSASVSVSDTGTAWRIAISGMADGEAYRVGLGFTASDGQVCYQTALVTVAPAAGVATWATLVDLDLTNCTDQTGLGTDGTYTLVIGGVNVTLVVSHSTAGNGTTTAALVNGTGLTISHLPGASAPTNRTFGFNLSGVYGADLKPDTNDLCLELVTSISSMPTNSDGITWEIGETNPITSNNPGYLTRLDRVSSTNYTTACGYRVTSSPTKSSGQSFKASAPTDFHAQLVGMQRSWRSYVDESSSVSTPGAPAIVGNCGSVLVAPTDSASDVWGSTTYGQLTVFGNGAAAPVVLTIKRIRVLARQPVV